MQILFNILILNFKNVNFTIKFLHKNQLAHLNGVATCKPVKKNYQWSTGAIRELFIRGG